MGEHAAATEATGLHLFERKPIINARGAEAQLCGATARRTQKHLPATNHLQYHWMYLRIIARFSYFFAQKSPTVLLSCTSTPAHSFPPEKRESEAPPIFKI